MRGNAPMGLFAGEDVEVRPSLWRNSWFLAFLVADLPVDLAIGLMTGMPRLENALRRADFPIPRATLSIIHLAQFLITAWPFVLPPLALLPFLAAWRWRDRAVTGLQIALVADLLLFFAACLAILLPLKTLLAGT